MQKNLDFFDVDAWESHSSGRSGATPLCLSLPIDSESLVNGVAHVRHVLSPFSLGVDVVRYFSHLSPLFSFSVLRRVLLHYVMLRDRVLLYLQEHFHSVT